MTQNSRKRRKVEEKKVNYTLERRGNLVHVIKVNSTKQQSNLQQLDLNCDEQLQERDEVQKLPTTDNQVGLDSGDEQSEQDDQHNRKKSIGRQQSQQRGKKGSKNLTKNGSTLEEQKTQINMLNIGDCVKLKNGRFIIICKIKRSQYITGQILKTTQDLDIQEVGAVPELFLSNQLEETQTNQIVGKVIVHFNKQQDGADYVCRFQIEKSGNSEFAFMLIPLPDMEEQIRGRQKKQTNKFQILDNTQELSY
eukprot:TRINITY_DN8172_c0_g1_i7.p1 TRINITY_DN8172_c0_g1~~TRINITY_DN8172_c0_g1_i7.p1  ORF type:complete len:251 (+),score=27.16 TRINITY_DN8172_c0_g1_i7:134-886(+)